MSSHSSVADSPATSTVTAPIVSLKAVGKGYGGVRALRGVDVDVMPGEILALVGENGAGKSTLGKVLMGVTAPSDGEILVEGRTVSFRSPHDALEQGFTGIAQEIALAPQLTVAENVFLGQEPRRAGMLQGRDLKRRFQALEDNVKFGIPGDVKVASLPLADQQRVEMLRAITRGSRVIVMDEPTAALSAGESEQLFTVLRGLRDAGTTIIFISHFLQEVLDLADRVVVLRDGQVVKVASASDETTETLITSMLGRSIEAAFPDKTSTDPEAAVRLEVSGLSRGQAFQDISFQVRAGEILGLAGLVGAGRTEVARAIFGADPCDSGTVTVDGRDTGRRSPRRSLKHGLSYLPESRRDDGLLLGRDGSENVVSGHASQFSRLGVAEPRRERSIARRMLDTVTASNQALNVPVSTLSGGNQQKVLLGRCLLGRPGVLIVDEPTRGVDVGAKVVIYEQLHRVAAEGAAVIVISSEHEELIGLAHRVLVMRKGHIVRELAEADITEENIVVAALTSGTNT